MGKFHTKRPAPSCDLDATCETPSSMPASTVQSAPYTKPTLQYKVSNSGNCSEQTNKQTNKGGEEEDPQRTPTRRTSAVETCPDTISMKDE